MSLAQDGEDYNRIHNRIQLKGTRAHAATINIVDSLRKTDSRKDHEDARKDDERKINASSMPAKLLESSHKQLSCHIVQSFTKN